MVRETLINFLLPMSSVLFNNLFIPIIVNKIMNIAIIGAGPIGCYCGHLLAQAGHQVEIYETHAQIGLPIQCTGLLTTDFDQFKLPKDSFLVNTFSQVEVNSPRNKVQIPQKEYLVDRHKFDLFFAEMAQKAGAKIFLQHTFLRKDKTRLIVRDLRNNQEKILTPQIVIAADGPNSPTAQAYGFYSSQRTNYFGVQAIVNGKFDPQSYQTFFGKEICLEYFAWIVPESATQVRVGLVAKKNPREFLNKFLKLHKFNAQEIQAGLIPLYCPQQRLKKDNCYLVGDAAGFVKATTLGGLVPGLKQAEILADCVINNKNYELEVKSLRKKLNLHLKIHRTMKKFSDEDWDQLIAYIGQDKIKRILQEHTRDNPLPLLIKALLKEPRFLRFMKYIF